MIIDHIGNGDLLRLHKTAFLASSTIPVDKVLSCYDWAHRMCRENRCVVSGFSSHLEKEVFDILLHGTQPVILVLARRLYRQPPPHLLPHLQSGRLLIISTSTAPRQSKSTAFTRNQYICEIADEILFVAAEAGSSLASLERMYKEKTFIHDIKA